MTRVTRAYDVPRDQAWRVVSDPRTYPTWLMGCRRIRAVDVDWPSPGARFHHEIGLTPLLVRDSTAVTVSKEPSVLQLLIRFRPWGVGRVAFTLAGDNPTQVTLDERIFDGWIGHISDVLLAPLIVARNWWSLRRLAATLEGDGGAPR